MRRVDSILYNYANTMIRNGSRHVIVLNEMLAVDDKMYSFSKTVSMGLRWSWGANSRSAIQDIPQLFINCVYNSQPQVEPNDSMLSFLCLVIQNERFLSVIPTKSWYAFAFPHMLATFPAHRLIDLINVMIHSKAPVQSTKSLTVLFFIFFSYFIS